MSTKRDSDGKRRSRRLTSEEMRLWKRVERTVTPIESPQAKRKMEKDIDDWLENASSLSAKKDQISLHRPQLEPYYPPIPESSRLKAQLKVGAIDDKTARKLTKGRVSIDAKIDLHGMTQEQAHRALARFLKNAFFSGYRMVLVITGKGPSGQGVLRRLVPVWISGSDLAAYVSGQREAHITHGGAGALYLRIRRNPGLIGGNRDQ
jgi:DNA-nicking Smr family endonuclease